MRACVVIFPGSNAETEMIFTLRDVCGAHTSGAWHTDSQLPTGTDLVALPGGFSYGDYLRTGAIAKVSPIVAAIRAHAARGGYVLGVCNGFQILTEAGLLAGALTRNVHQRFECGDWFVQVAASGPFTPSPGAVWKLPVAHGEGRFQADAATLRRLEGDPKVRPAPDTTYRFVTRATAARSEHCRCEKQAAARTLSSPSGSKSSRVTSGSV